MVFSAFFFQSLPGGQFSFVPLIIIDDGRLRDLTAKATDAIKHAEDPFSVFARAGTLTRTSRDENGQPKIESLDRPRMRRRLSEVADFFTLRNGESGYELVGTNSPLLAVNDTVYNGYAMRLARKRTGERPAIYAPVYRARERASSGKFLGGRAMDTARSGNKTRSRQAPVARYRWS